MADARTRDHLANERTFLAWVRTALGLIGLGFVLARMGLFLRELVRDHVAGFPGTSSTYLGHEFLICGIVFLALGTALSGWSGWIYHRNRRAIETDGYVPAAGTVWVLTAVVVLGGLTITGLAVWRVVTMGR